MFTALLLAFALLSQNATPPGIMRANPARLTAAHTMCDNQIDTRLTSLSDLSSRVSGLKRLSDTEKNQFQSQISTATAGLTSLKAKCDADTDLSTLRTDIKTIFTTFRIYAVQGPQMRLLAAADTLGTLTDQLQSLYTALASRVSQAGNPANLTTLLSDMQAKITAATGQFNSVISTVTSLTPDSFNTNSDGVKSAFQTARTALKAGETDIKAALSDARQIRSSLTGASPAVTSAPSPTP